MAYVRNIPANGMVPMHKLQEKLATAVPAWHAAKEFPLVPVPTARPMRIAQNIWMVHSSVIKMTLLLLRELVFPESQSNRRCIDVIALTRTLARKEGIATHHTNMVMMETPCAAAKAVKTAALDVSIISIKWSPCRQQARVPNRFMPAIPPKLSRPLRRRRRPLRRRRLPLRRRRRPLRRRRIYQPLATAVVFR